MQPFVFTIVGDGPFASATALLCLAVGFITHRLITSVDNPSKASVMLTLSLALVSINRTPYVVASLSPCSLVTVCFRTCL